MSSNPDYDRWYAARHVRILLSPTHRLETFGNTLVNYHLISELDDHPGKIRVREGRLEAHQPLVIAPHFAEVTAEGFSDEAKVRADRHRFACCRHRAREERGRGIARRICRGAAGR